ncbi:TorF family putative porin [Phenylobacterium sp.]|uniref:TorF family putative porin n=1 Tax=Phenylobacterium sp. TaxID=1871053 RepID=UPI00286AABBE|nr:TorF family putative porin [Phenylobacterium sp.]
MRSQLAAAALVALAAPAQAHARDWGIFSAVMLTSDYRYQGVSESRGRPVVQGYAHWQRADGLYVGLFATQVDFGYAGAPTYELDGYAGKNFSVNDGRTELKLEEMWTVFPDNRTPGPTLDFAQTKIQAKHVAGPWTTLALASYVPRGSYGSGEVRRVEGEADFAVTPRLTLKVLAGAQGGGRGHDRIYWSLGAAYAWKTLAFELRYLDNDRTRSNCGFQPKACDAAVVGTLTVSLPPIL